METELITRTNIYSKERMAVYRAKMRSKGMRSVQIWLPDTRSSQFIEEARRQSLIIASDKEDNNLTIALEKSIDVEEWK